MVFNALFLLTLMSAVSDLGLEISVRVVISQLHARLLLSRGSAL